MSSSYDVELVDLISQIFTDGQEGKWTPLSYCLQLSTTCRRGLTAALEESKYTRETYRLLLPAGAGPFAGYEHSPRKRRR